MTTIIALGHKKIRFLVVDRKGARFSVVQSRDLELASDMFTGADTAGASAVIRDFARQHKIPLNDVVFTISHRDQVFKEVMLPWVSVNEIGKILVNEIEKLPRFLPGKYSFTYQARQLPSVKKVHVVYFVILREALERAARILEGAGARLKAFDLMPCPVASLERGPAPEEGVSVVVMVEETLTHVIMLSGREVLGVFAIDEGEDELARGEAGLKAWTQAVERTLRSFEAMKATTVAGVMLFWDNARFPALDRALEGSSLRTIASPAVDEGSVIDGVAFSEIPFHIAPLAGIVQRQARGGHFFNVEHIWHLEATPGYARRMVALVLAYFALIGLVVAVPLLKVDRERKELLAEKAGIVEKIALLDSKTITLEEERRKARALRRSLLEQARMVSRIKQFSWADIFDHVNAVLPADVWLSAFSLDNDGKLSVSGTGLTMDAVAGFLRSMEKNERLKDVEMSSTTKRMIDKVNVVDFRIEAAVAAEAREKP